MDDSRRDLLAAAAAAIAAALAPAAASAASGGSSAGSGGSRAASAGAPGPVPADAKRWRALRRVVVGDGPDGAPRVIADGAPSNVLELNGTRITRLWEAPGVPASLPLDGDAGATAGNAYRAGFAGTSFYVAEIPPGIGPAQIPLHRNDTLDYMAILAGEIELVLDGREIPLRTGDTLVLGGANHSWRNRGGESCLLLFVVVTAARELPDRP
jgi:mannose-6-phosphate isomerase-like protein (cupin superfamily)